MSTIRPFLPPAAPVQGRTPARASEPTGVEAARKAFFRTAAEAQPRPEPQPTRRVESRPLDRLPRPGSILDIKV